MKFLVLGCNGMAGHTISLYLNEQGHDVEGYARKKSKYIKTIVGDVKNYSFLQEVIKDGNYDSVINCTGILNQYAEDNPGDAILINSYLPHFLEEVTRGSRTQIIQMSTDCVFSGEEGGYTEESIPDGTTVYDRTKALGELNNDKDITFRNSIVGPDINENGIGLLNWFMQQSGPVQGYKGAIWTGQMTLQLAKTMEKAAEERVYGLINAVPKESITKCDLLELFNKYIRRVPIEVVPMDGYSIDKSLIRTNYDCFKYEIPGYEVMVKELGDWMREHKDLYPHYDL